MTEQDIVNSELVASDLTQPLMAGAGNHPASLLFSTLSSRSDAFENIFAGPPPVASGTLLPLLIPAILMSAAAIAFLGVDVLFSYDR